MTSSDKIKHFLNPKTIALIGASDNEKKVGSILIKKLRNFKGKVIPINNKSSLIDNKQAYKTVLQYPKEIDLAIIAIPAKFVCKTLKQCAKNK